MMLVLLSSVSSKVKIQSGGNHQLRGGYHARPLDDCGVQVIMNLIILKANKENYRPHKELFLVHTPVGNPP